MKEIKQLRESLLGYDRCPYQGWKEMKEMKYDVPWLNSLPNNEIK